MNLVTFESSLIFQTLTPSESLVKEEDVSEFLLKEDVVHRKLAECMHQQKVLKKTVKEMMDPSDSKKQTTLDKWLNMSKIHYTNFGLY